MKIVYQDPIAAAWMERHHNVKFLPPYEGNIDFGVLNVISKRGRAFKFEVAEESFELFKPQIGDLVYGVIVHSNIRTFVPHFQYYVWGDETLFYSEKGREEYYKTHSVTKIIQRHKIPFMWPELG